MCHACLPQDKSHVMDIKVKNRKAAEGKLKKFIDGINITDEIAGFGAASVHDLEQWAWNVTCMG